MPPPTAPDPAPPTAPDPAPTPEPAPEPTPAPEPAPAPEPDPEPAPAPEPAARRRGRARTPLLIAAAAVLGVLAGTVTGYAVQYDRAPTPLPPLAQPKLDAPAPLALDETSSVRSVHANRWHKSDEDLSQLLIEAPAGARTSFSGYVSPDSFAADFFDHPGPGLRALVVDDIRRIASRRWEQGDSDFVDVTLLQFRARAGADNFQASQGSYMSEKGFAGNDGMGVPGIPGGAGHAWIDSEVSEEPGFLPMRGARAVLRRGDIVIDIHYSNNRGKVDKDVLLDLAKRQMERL
ncbi:hypothetical protein [Streptomyces xanthophaeus]|uniref:hypothetical protein n=1 Tax=Streptomyces xanthophaeus TaxID=67385 RepID=UPI00068BE920|nr:hypothetical protein [Streptomyces xanthophaeus]